MTPAEQLRDGLSSLSLPDVEPAALTEALLAFAAELERWNRVYNLTRIPPGEKTISHHLLDSLSILPWVGSGKLLDVGSGGGLPGIPVALARPSVEVHLLDSNIKKTRFLQHAAITLGLGNVTVHHCRVESLAGEFDTITCRAFASLADTATMTAHLLAPRGRVLAMKAELADEPDSVPPLEITAINTLSVPGVAEARHLVVMEHAPGSRGG